LDSRNKVNDRVLALVIVSDPTGMELVKHRRAGAKVERDVVVDDTTRATWHSRCPSLLLNVLIVDHAVRFAVVGRIVGGVKALALQEGAKIVHVDNAINGSGIGHIHRLGPSGGCLPLKVIVAVGSA
jgi:hypothetical protein